MSNILKAIHNIEKSLSAKLDEIKDGANRINSIGEGLEVYIKNAFADALDENDTDKRDEKIEQVFSYLGNANNIPDAILKGGDAIEVKKIESFSGEIPLNSSFPKDKLYSDDPKLNKEGRTCEQWGSKEMIYAIGHVPKGKKKLQHLWLIDGACYAANKETYGRVESTIKSGINDITSVELSETVELGRINKVDPLGITYLRVRGMWHIQHPNKVFKDVYIPSKVYSFSLSAIIKKDKFNSFSKVDKSLLEKNPNVVIRDVKIKNPNNPAKRFEAVLITVEKK